MKGIIKKLLSLVLCIAICMSLLPGVYAASNIAQDGNKWYIDSAGCLHITGSFWSMGNSSVDLSPWHLYKKEIVSVVAEEGARLDPKVFNPCMSRLFENCPNLVSVNLDKLDTSKAFMMEKCSVIVQALNIFLCLTLMCRMLNSSMKCSKDALNLKRLISAVSGLLLT